MELNKLDYEQIRPNNEVALRLTAEGFDQQRSTAYNEQALAVLNRCDGFVSAKCGIETIGFTGYRNLNIHSGRVLYVSTIMVDKNWQGHSISSSLILNALKINDNDFVGMRTQSARMYVAAKKILPTLIPNLESKDLGQDDSKLWQAGEELANYFSIDSFPFIRGAYSSAMYSELPNHPKYPNLYKYIDFNNGDAILCIARSVHKNNIDE